MCEYFVHSSDSSSSTESVQSPERKRKNSTSGNSEGCERGSPAKRPATGGSQQGVETDNAACIEGPDNGEQPDTESDTESDTEPDDWPQQIGDATGSSHDKSPLRMSLERRVISDHFRYKGRGLTLQGGTYDPWENVPRSRRPSQDSCSSNIYPPAQPRGEREGKQPVEPTQPIKDAELPESVGSAGSAGEKKFVIPDRSIKGRRPIIAASSYDASSETSTSVKGNPSGDGAES
jgi:hypothetical protein